MSSFPARRLAISNTRVINTHTLMDTHMQVRARTLEFCKYSILQVSRTWPLFWKENTNYKSLEKKCSGIFGFNTFTVRHLNSGFLQLKGFKTLNWGFVMYEESYFTNFGTEKITFITISTLWGCYIVHNSLQSAEEPQNICNYLLS